MKKATVISIFNLKGGCGKTYYTDLFAQHLHDKGFKVVVFDSDIGQIEQMQKQVFRAFSKIEVEISSYTSVSTTVLELKDSINMNQAAFDYIFIDFSLGHTESLKECFGICDIIFIPFESTHYYNETVKLIESFKLLFNPNIKYEKLIDIRKIQEPINYIENIIKNLINN